MRVHIVGLGLMGASLAAALVRAGQEVDGSDREAGIRDQLQGRGWLNAELAPEEAELVVLAIPPAALVAELPVWLARTSGNTALTDLASVKGPVLAACAGSAGAERFYPGHPLCGREGKGYVAADPELYRGQAWVLTPEEQAAPFARERVEAMLATLEARPVLMTAAEHDRLLARVSHLPQLLASALALVAGRSASVGDLEKGLFGGGFRDMTRLAASPAELWAEICRLNGGEIAAALAEFRAGLDELEGALGSDEIAPLLTEAAGSKSRWPSS